MRIVTSYRPGRFSDRIRRVRVSGSGALLTAVYIAGVVSGCSLYLTSEWLRKATDRFCSVGFSERFSLSAFLIIGVVCSLAIGAFVFGAGLSVVGQPCIYLTPFCIGAVIGMFCMSAYHSESSGAAAWWFLLLPFCGTAVCGSLYMCEYASEMASELRRGPLDREAGETKKYILRSLLLLLSILTSNLANALLAVLVRHFS